MADFATSQDVRTQDCSPPLLVMETSFKGDEGYSEDTRSQDEDSTMGGESGGQTMLPTALVALQNAVMALTEGQRSEHAYQVLRTLRTSSIAEIVERLTPLLHLDPVERLPPDVTTIIFSFLSPASLLGASRVSKAWRERTLDSFLWKEKFRREGWVLDMSEVIKFEENYRKPALRKTLSRRAASHEWQRRQKRRMQEGQFARPQESPDLPDRSMQSQEIDLISDVGPYAAAQKQDQEMRDADSPPPLAAEAPNFSDRTDSDLSIHSNDSESKDQPLVLRSYSGGPRVNFHHVYKQKRRLEENWNDGRFKSFQLPHRDHPEEAHSECVYTIQYCGKYLVSGSRDRTLRIWDLDTQRLIRRPLEGHKASVLCLQFDSNPKEDLIVSGSSDTDVILWQFSTGNMIKRIQNAHNESVLNLKFDSRFLVTCSKDKMIKIWNRKELKPGDVDYPKKGVAGGGRCPSYIVDMSSVPHPAELDRFLTWKQMEPIPEYSLIMKIDSHGAAVNAVHIYQDQLVSASGDRALRVFDIHSGVCTAVCKGHTKGIACVQYDGKRIVSGSSDNTIRVFDPISQAEVACLKGHSKLVRTIQAAFGDAPGTEEDLELEARESDRAYLEAVQSGRIPPSPTRTRRSSRRDHTAGSRRPEDITALGAKIPPGGGGTPWSRIVSGSYDETIIIWKKASDGRWVPGQTLRQADALMAAGGPLIAQSERHPHARQMLQAMQHHHQQQGHQTQQHQNQQASQQNTQSAQPAPQAGPSSQASSSQAPPPQPQPPQRQSSQSSQSTNPPLPAPYPGIHPHPQDANWYNQTLQHSHTTTHAQTHAQASATATPLPTPAPLAPVAHTAGQPANVGAIPQATLQPHQAAQIQQHMAQLPQAPAQPNARVFKLQFDARRVICCSQDPKIVGWDFANGDEDIIQCVPFFGTPR